MMKKRFLAKVIKGRGRGKKLGMKTLNLKIPQGLDLKKGIWECSVCYKGKRYGGLLHYGPRPTFGEGKESLEVLVAENLGEKIGKVEVEIGRWVRRVRKFGSGEDLLRQVKKDQEELKEGCF
jgi:riboflavin kinase/FMN adenylyltransferase